MCWRFQIAPAHLALLDRAWTPSRLTINRTLWATGLALQCALAVAVFRRGIARRFPCFAGLICFYPLRAGLLFFLAGRVDADVYNPLFSWLAFAEILLQAAIAVELLWRINQETGVESRSSTERRWVALLIFLALAGGLTWLVLRFTPARTPVDRVQVFCVVPNDCTVCRCSEVRALCKSDAHCGRLCCLHAHSASGIIWPYSRFYQARCGLVSRMVVRARRWLSGRRDLLAYRTLRHEE